MMEFRWFLNTVQAVLAKQHAHISAHIKNYRKYERRIAGLALLKNIVTEFLLIIQKKQKYVFKL